MHTIESRARRRRMLLGLAGLLAGLLLQPLPTFAQQWPTRPIRMIVGFAPGSTPDNMARLLAERLAPRLGQPVVVENKPGAAGNIGVDAVAKAAPDGHSFGLTISGPLAANTLLFRHLPYKPQTDIEAVTIAATQPSVLVVPAQSDIADVRTLLARLKARPTRYNYASMGMGSISHLAMAAIASASGSEPVHVPYTSSGQAITAMLAGDAHMAVLPAASVLPHVQAGRLRALAVTTAKRSALLPQLPTLSETGLADVRADAWMGVIAPARTAPAIIERMQREIAAIIKSDELAPRLQAQTIEPVASTPAEMRATIQADLARWQPLIRRYRISLD